MRSLRIVLIGCLFVLPLLSEAAKKKPKNNAKPAATKSGGNEYSGYKRNIVSLGIQGLKPDALYYSAKAEGKKPLLIFLHGKGGGDKPIGNKGCEIAKGFSEQSLFCDVVHPYSPNGWSPKCIDSLIDYMLKNYKIDETRIYVAGSSMGGAGTWKYGFEGKRDIAAFIPIASGASKTAKIHDKWNLEDMKDKPIWMFHGDKDTVVPYANAKETAEKMEKINPQFKFTVFEGVSHGSRGPTFKTKELYPWILEHSAKK